MADTGSATPGGKGGFREAVITLLVVMPVGAVLVALFLWIQRALGVTRSGLASMLAMVLVIPLARLMRDKYLDYHKQHRVTARVGLLIAWCVATFVAMYTRRFLHG